MREEGPKEYSSEWYELQTQRRGVIADCHRCDDRGLVRVEDGTPSGTDWKCTHVAQDLSAKSVEYLADVGFKPDPRWGPRPD